MYKTVCAYVQSVQWSVSQFADALSTCSAPAPHASQARLAQGAQKMKLPRYWDPIRAYIAVTRLEAKLHWTGLSALRPGQRGFTPRRNRRGDHQKKTWWVYAAMTLGEKYYDGVLWCMGCPTWRPTYLTTLSTYPSDLLTRLQTRATTLAHAAGWDTLLRYCTSDPKEDEDVACKNERPLGQSCSHGRSWCKASNPPHYLAPENTGLSQP